MEILYNMYENFCLSNIYYTNTFAKVVLLRTGYLAMCTIARKQQLAGRARNILYHISTTNVSPCQPTSNASLQFLYPRLRPHPHTSHPRKHTHNLSTSNVRVNVQCT